MTLFEALMGGHFTVSTGNIAGNLTKIFQKSQMPRGLPGGMGGFGIDRYIKYECENDTLTETKMAKNQNTIFVTKTAKKGLR